MNRTQKLSVSMMCADLLNLEQEIKTLESLNVDYLHIDIMDNNFVPNLTFGIDTVNRMREITTTPFDIHLLTNYPLQIIRSLKIQENDIMTIHSECKDDIMENIAFIKKQKSRFGLALNPETSIRKIHKYLPYVDVILLMLIVPGFAGSTMIHGIMEKVGTVKNYLQDNNFDNIEIEVDGSVSIDKAVYMKNLGATIFVGGTSAIFKKDEKIQNTITDFYKIMK
ncbi:MAG: ribulose-phosphate 3-epimerase [Prevotellaceae bacterium]|jgi:ribulose-phosphate 3-epimerase|nr:ribulose-phosphate 3-epimerase [Prevotellaceae bacterium]